MQKHFEKLQQEKEDAAMSKLQSLMPQLGSIVRDLALKEVDWNVDKAALLLRRFQVSNASKLTLLQKVMLMFTHQIFFQVTLPVHSVWPLQFHWENVQESHREYIRKQYFH